MKNGATKQGKDFYTMLHLFKIADCINVSLRNDGMVSGTLKHLLSNVAGSVKVMMREAMRRTPPEDVKTWNAEWERDYLSYLAIFEKMAEMTDEQRNAVEQAAEGILNNELQLIDNTKNND